MGVVLYAVCRILYGCIILYGVLYFTRGAVFYIGRRIFCGLLCYTECIIA